MSTSGIRFGSDLNGMRSEDFPLLTGRGQFSDDLNVEGQLHAVFVRAPVAHADIDDIETEEALSIPGVIGIYTGSDLVTANIGDVPAATSINGRNGNPMLHAPVPVLAHKRIRHVGEPVAIVVRKPSRRLKMVPTQFIWNYVSDPQRRRLPPLSQRGHP